MSRTRQGTLRRVGARLPTRLRPLAVRVASRGRSSVSVVVAVTEHNALFLADCADSLGQQTRRADEVVVVATGSSAQVAGSVDRLVRSSWRFRPLLADSASVAAALEAGGRRATGAYVLGIEAGDTLTPRAVESLAGALDASGSDLAIGGGSADVIGATLDSVPEGVEGRDPSLVMVRRSAAPRVGLGWMAGPLGDWLPSVRSVLRAERFDVTRNAVRQGPRRGTGSGFGAMQDTAAWSAEWGAAAREILGQLDTRPQARRCFLRWLLAEDAVRFLDDVERCTEAQWDALSGAVGGLWAETPADVRAEVPTEARVRAWLAAQRRRSDLEAFAVARWRQDDQLPTVVRQGRVLADLQLADLPDEVLELSPDESRLVARIRRLRWSGPSDVEADLVAFVKGVGLQHGQGRVRISAVEDEGDRLDLHVLPSGDPSADELAGERFQDHADAVVRVRLDVGALVSRGWRRWQLEVAWEGLGLRRTAVCSDVEARGSAGAFRGRVVGQSLVAFEAHAAAFTSHAAERSSEEEPSGAPAWGVTGLVLHEDVLTVTGDATGPLAVRLLGPRASVGAPAQVGAGRFEAQLSLRHDPWSLGETSLPPGPYRLVRAEGEGEASLLAAAGLAERLPVDLHSTCFRARVDRAPDGSVAVTLRPPLPAEETGPHAQQQLQRWYLTGEHRLDPSSVYLQSYTGQVATDSPLGIHHALRRLRPDLRLRWGVADRSTRLPEGAEPVLMRTREWYDALATSAFLVTNIDLEPWFHKRPGQRLLQTYHGYPSKAMGISAWQAKNLTPLRIEEQLRRTSRTWDLLLTPTEAMDVHYRQQYRYDGPILSRGYPRDDSLVTAEAGSTRELARQSLGLEGRTAVLYAPTWRDDLATNFRAAALPPVFDVDAAAAALGPGYVILLRGHRFHHRRPPAGARVLDVTDYPEINDLVLAADVAVLDYSSLRFDLALVGRPMVFLVPDLDRYGGGVRGFLYDFRTSTPGPLVDTTDEVVAALRDVEGLAATWGPALRRFNAEFNRHQDGHAGERVVREFFGTGPARAASEGAATPGTDPSAV